MNRRSFASSVGSAASALAAAGSIPAMAAMPEMEMPATGSDVHIGMIAFPEMTYLDFAGPNDALARPRSAKIHVLAKTMDVIRTDTGMRILPDMTLQDAPELDLLFIGGGPGSTALMSDDETLAFLRARAPRARWVTSVCTGALVLGAAGLLRGYKAATHWTAMEVLPILGAQAVDERVVIDRNRITGGGVTAGIDFSLAVVAQIWGRDMAEMIQLGSEYDPHPPFNAGSPKTASPQLVAHFRGMWSSQTDARKAAALGAARGFPSLPA